MTDRRNEGHEQSETDRALVRAEQYYDRQNPPQPRPIQQDSDRAWEFDWLFRRNVDD